MEIADPQLSLLYSISRIAFRRAALTSALSSKASSRCSALASASSSTLHSGHRFANPGLSGFNSNSSEQILQTLIGKGIKHLSTLNDSVLSDSTTWPQLYLRIRQNNSPTSHAEPTNFTLCTPAFLTGPVCAPNIAELPLAGKKYPSKTKRFLIYSLHQLRRKEGP
jgi:hypothetical protein